MHSKFVSVATIYGLVGLATALPQPGKFVKRLPDGETGNGWEQQVLELHNRERTGCGQQPLVWNDELAKGSANNANQCVFRHTNDGQRSGAGENIAEGTIGFYGPDKLCESWIDEKNGGGEDGHYTQIVWKDTTDLGCAVAECNGNNYLVCQYWPAGNFNGDNANQVCVAGNPERSSPGEHFGGSAGSPNAPGGGSSSSPVSGGSPTGGHGQPSGGSYGQPTRGRKRPSGGNQKSPVKSGPKKPCPDEKKSPVHGNRPSGGNRPHHHRKPHHESSPVQGSPDYGNKRVSDVDNDDNTHRPHRDHGDHDFKFRRPNRDHGDDDENDFRRPHRTQKDDDDFRRPHFSHNDDNDNDRRPHHREESTSGHGKEPCPDEGRKNRD